MHFEQILKFIKFSTVGIFVTLLSMFLTYISIGILETPLYISYFAIYLSSILISYILNSKFVFKFKKNKKNLITYYIIYGSGMFIGIFILIIFEAVIFLENVYLAFMVIPFTMSWNYFLLHKLEINDKETSIRGKYENTR